MLAYAMELLRIELSKQNRLHAFSLEAIALRGVKEFD